MYLKRLFTLAFNTIPMKTLRLFLFILIMSVSLGSIAAPLQPLDKATIAQMTPQQKEARLEQIRQRVEEIRVMDRSQLTDEQRNELKTELKAMNKERKHLGPHSFWYPFFGLSVIILVLIVFL